MAKIKALMNDLQSAYEKPEAAEAKLKEVEVAVVPESEKYQLLRVAYEESKMECVGNFNSGFNTVIAQIQALYPGIDVSGMDLDKIVGDGQLVDAPTEEEVEAQREVQQPVEDLPFGLITGPQEPPVVGDDPVGLVREPEVELPSVDVRRQDVVMDSLDSEATL